jgi:hypothetical protein
MSIPPDPATPPEKSDETKTLNRPFSIQYPDEVLQYPGAKVITPRIIPTTIRRIPIIIRLISINTDNLSTKLIVGTVG